MESTDWAPEHSQALRELHAKGLSYAMIARELNRRFGTDYSRNATLSRGKRIGLVTPKAPKEWQPPRSRKKTAPRSLLRDERQTGVPRSEPEPIVERQPVKLRCVGIAPRLLSFDQLEAADCRYPYGGDKDDEPIAFCGHPKRNGSSYCTPHFHLTRSPEDVSGRPASPVNLRLVAAA